MTEKLKIPGDMVQKPNYFVILPYGNVAFSQEGISYQSAGFFWHILFKVNFLNKFFWKFCENKLIAYKDIIDVQKYKNNGIKVITATVDGSYYLFFQNNQDHAIDTMVNLINRCRRFGFNAAMNNMTDVSDIAVKAKKSIIPVAIIMNVAAAVALICNAGLVGFIVSIFAIGPSKQTEKKILYFISIACIIISIFRLFIN